MLRMRRLSETRLEGQARNFILALVAVCDTYLIQTLKRAWVMLDTVG